MNSFLLNIYLFVHRRMVIIEWVEIKEENQRTQGTYSSPNSNSFETTSQTTNPSPSTHENNDDDMVNKIIDDQKEEDQVIVDETSSISNSTTNQNQIK